VLSLPADRLDSLLERNKAFDDELMADMRQVGGEEYAGLAALTYRQTLAAHKLVADAVTGCNCAFNIVARRWARMKSDMIWGLIG
jgi:hypothetical protein